MVGQQAKAARAAHPEVAPPPPRPRKTSGPSGRKQPRAPREPSMDPANVARRQRRRDAADEARTVEEYGKRAAAQLAAPARPSEAAGATASNRAASFAKPGRSDDAARQAVERQVRKLVAEIVRQARKDPLGAAAALGGAVRDPHVRSLLAQAGITLSEQIEMDTALINQLAAIVGPASRGRGAHTVDEETTVSTAALLLAPDGSPAHRAKKRKSGTTEAEQPRQSRAATTIARTTRVLSPCRRTSCCTRASRWRRSTWGATRRHRSGRRRGWAPSWSSRSRTTRRRWRSSSGGPSEAVCAPLAGWL